MKACEQNKYTIAISEVCCFDEPNKNQHERTNKQHKKVQNEKKKKKKKNWEMMARCMHNCSLDASDKRREDVEKNRNSLKK